MKNALYKLAVISGMTISLMAIYSEAIASMGVASNSVTSQLDQVYPEGTITGSKMTVNAQTNGTTLSSCGYKPTTCSSACYYLDNAGTALLNGQSARIYICDQSNSNNTGHTVDLLVKATGTLDYGAIFSKSQPVSGSITLTCWLNKTQLNCNTPPISQKLGEQPLIWGPVLQGNYNGGWNAYWIPE